MCVCRCSCMSSLYIDASLHIQLLSPAYSGADNCKNRSNYDTSNRFGTNTLWGSLFKKKTRATHNFKMATMFQDGRHGVSLNVIFCLKMAVNGKKRLLWQQSVFWVCKMYSQCYKYYFKCSDYFNMAAYFQHGCHRLSRNTSFALDGSKQSKRWFGE